jgi:hypothetical protein
MRLSLYPRIQRSRKARTYIHWKTFLLVTCKSRYENAEVGVVAHSLDRDNSRFGRETPGGFVDLELIEYHQHIDRFDRSAS